jgi:hypothetical protein
LAKLDFRRYNSNATLSPSHVLSRPWKPLLLGNTSVSASRPRPAYFAASLLSAFCLLAGGCGSGVVDWPTFVALQASPSYVDLGSVALGITTSTTVSLVNKGTAPVRITQLSITGQPFSIAAQDNAPTTIPAGGTFGVMVNFNPTLPGPQSGQLSILTSDSPTVAATVTLSGAGQAPATPTLTGISCASASMGGTGTDLCTATLSGPAPSGGLRVALSSNNAALVVQTGALVHENSATVQFNVSVSPVTTVQTAILTASAGTVSKTFALQLTPPVPTLAINTTSVAFGSVAVNTPAKQTVLLTSTGTAPVTVAGAAVSGAGFTIAPMAFPLTLYPGKTGTLTLQFDPLAQGATAGQLTVKSNSSINSTAVLPLTGTGMPQLTGISCASASMVGTGSDLCTATLSGPAPSGGLRVALSSNNPALVVQTGALVHENSATVQFNVSVSPVATVQTATLTASAEGAIKTFLIQLNAAAPVLGISTSNVAFGNIPVNAAATRTVTLTSTGAANLTINSASATGKGFSVTQGTFPLTLAPGQAATIGVVFTPSKQGTAAGQLIVNSNSSGSTNTTIALTGAGTPPGSFSYTESPLQDTLTPPNPTIPISSNFFGMTIHHTSTPFPSFPVSTFRFWDVAPWSVVEPTSGQFNWDHMNTAIRIGQENGIKDYIFTFGSLPSWASTNPADPCTGGDGPGSCASPNLTALDSFTTTLVQNYCGVIKYYETWNEPNNTGYWDGTNAQLLTVAQHVYQIAKDPANCGCTNGTCRPNGGVNPNQVLTPSISGITSYGMNWLESYLTAAGPQYPYADIATFHGYHVTNPEDIAPQIQSLNVVLAQHGLANLPLWNTEASWGNTSTALGQDQASWLMRYHMVQAASGVSRFVWYAYDNCGWGTLWENTVCVNPQNPVGKVTVPGQAYAVIESWMSGATLPSCQQYQNGLWACELTRAGGFDSWMLWSSTGTSISVPIPSNSSLTYYKDWQNNLNGLSSSISVSQMPVLLENQPL